MKVEYLADRKEFLPAIARWYFDQWGYKDSGNSYELTCQRLNQKLNKTKLPIPLVAVEEDKLVGTIQLKLREMEVFPEREFWLGSLYVDQQYRGRGIAQKLIERVIELSQQFKIHELWLQTEKLDGGLYGRLGWTVTESINQNGDEIAVMHRRIGV